MQHKNNFLTFIIAFYMKFFGIIEKIFSNWFIPTAARFLFAAILLPYYLNSAFLKIGSGFPGIFIPQDNAYFQIIPSVVEHYGYNASQVPFFPYGLIVFAGTYAEFILPILIVIGFMSRFAALGMSIFILVQTYVDIVFLHVDSKTIGAWFDTTHNSEIMDIRSLWIFLLLVIIIKGPGCLSLDTLFCRWRISGKAQNSSPGAIPG